MAIATSFVSQKFLSLQAFLHSELQRIARAGEVKQVKNTEKIVYRSAMALRSRYQEDAMDAANEIVMKLIELRSNFSKQEDTISIEVVPPGLLFFRFGEIEIAQWLQALCDRVLPAAEPAWQPFPWQPVETAQYAHARCCSLLRLAHREAAIAFVPEAIDRPSAGSNVLAPAELSLRTLQSWRIDRDRWQSQEFLSKFLAWETLRHPSERCLLVCMAAAADILHGFGSERLDSQKDEKKDLQRNSQRDLPKISESLGRAFLYFHQECRMFGDVARTRPDLATTRLGLTLATQKLLWELLCLRLHAIAPREL